jgi:hypothetical protein
MTQRFGTAILGALALVVLAGTAGCASDANDDEEQVVSSSEAALSTGDYVVTPPGGTWMYTNNGWLLIHFCSFVYYSPTPADWGNGWVRVWYKGEANYHPAALGQVRLSALGRQASNGRQSCGVGSAGGGSTTSGGGG